MLIAMLSCYDEVSNSRLDDLTEAIYHLQVFDARYGRRRNTRISYNDRHALRTRDRYVESIGI